MAYDKDILFQTPWRNHKVALPIRYKILFCLIAILFFVTSKCGYGAEFGSFRGKIVDAETKEPVEGAVVLIDWRELHFFAGSTFYDAQETLTDKNGEFYIPGIWIFNPWNWISLHASATIYKSGYYGIDVPWKSLLKPWGEPIAGTRKTYVLEVKDGKPLILLKKLTIEERKRYSTPDWGDIPSEKVKLLIQEVNKERNFLGLGNVGPVRR